MSENFNTSFPWNDAIAKGLDSPAGDQVRKLIALELVEENPDMPPEEAAVHGDRTWFRKFIEFMVSIGRMDKEDAVLRLIDRAHAAFVAFVKNAAPHLIRLGCIAAGTYVGMLFSNPVIGGTIGRTIGNHLATLVPIVLQTVAYKLHEAARSLWLALKCRLSDRIRAFREENPIRNSATLQA